MIARIPSVQDHLLIQARRLIRRLSARRAARHVTFSAYVNPRASTAQKINLRRPTSGSVQAQVLSHYRSDSSSAPATATSWLAGDLTVSWRGIRLLLRRRTGHRPGLRARNIFRRSKSIYLLGEIIHNPEVNDQIRNMGIQIFHPADGGRNDAAGWATWVMIPFDRSQHAERLRRKGCVLVDTPARRAWRVETRAAIFKGNATSIIHAKPSMRDEDNFQATAYGRALSVSSISRRRLRLHHSFTAATTGVLEKIQGRLFAGFRS